MKYVLPTTCLTKYQCSQLDKVIAPILLNALSAHRNVSRIILYSPEHYGGFGVYDIWHLQGGEKIKFLFLHYRRHDTIGQLLKISLQWLQMEAGVKLPFYTYAYEKIETILTECCLKHLFQYIDSCHATLHETNPWTYTAPRVNDFFLQEVFFKSSLPRYKVALLNEVRMALRIITASDIVPVNGSNTILPNILSCVNLRESKLDWPRCDALHEHWKPIWRDALTTMIEPILKR